MMAQLTIHLDADPDTYGIGGAGDINVGASIAAAQEAIEEAVRAAYPDAEIEIIVDHATVGWLFPIDAWGDDGYPDDALARDVDAVVNAAIQTYTWIVPLVTQGV
jgi:hypothetical protein